MSCTKKVRMTWVVKLANNETVTHALNHIRDEEGRSVRNLKAIKVMGNEVTIEGYKRVRSKK